MVIWWQFLKTAYSNLYLHFGNNLRVFEMDKGESIKKGHGNLMAISQNSL